MSVIEIEDGASIGELVVYLKKHGVIANLATTATPTGECRDFVVQQTYANKVGRICKGAKTTITPTYEAVREYLGYKTEEQRFMKHRKEATPPTKVVVGILHTLSSANYNP